jgi:hypothetical protein
LRRLKAITVLTSALSLPGLLAVAAVTAATASAAPTAQTAQTDAPADTITIDFANSQPSSVGLLTVGVTSTSPIASLAVHVINPDTHADVLDPTMVEKQSDPIGLTFHGVWTVATPVTTAQLPIGSYDIAVDANDVGGTTVTGVKVPTSWEFKSVPVVTFNNPPLIDFGHPTGQVTGTVALRAPDGTRSAYQGAISLIDSWSAGPQPAQTDASGNFSIAITPPSPGGQDPGASVEVNVPDTAANRAAGNAHLDFSVPQDPTALKAKSPVAVTYGGKVSVTGSLTYRPRGQATFVPVTRPTKVEVFRSGHKTSVPDATGMTDGHGNFAITLPASTGTTWMVGGGIDLVQNLLQSSGTTVTENVTYNTVITNFMVSPGQHRSLTFSGCLGLPTNVPGAPVPPVSALKLQWAADQNGPWHNLSTQVSKGGPCGHNGARFSGQATAQVSSAFYRADFPGALTTSSDHNGYHSARSGRVHVTVR